MKITGIGRRFGLFCMIALVFAGGCTTSVMQSTPALPGQQSEGGNPVVTNLKAANTGFYLLYGIPVWRISVGLLNGGAVPSHFRTMAPTICFPIIWKINTCSGCSTGSARRTMRTAWRMSGSGKMYPAGSGWESCGKRR